MIGCAIVLVQAFLDDDDDYDDDTLIFVVVVCIERAAKE